VENVRPGQWLVLASGALLFVFSFLDVFKDDDNAWANFGTVTWPALLGLIAAGATAAALFGNVSLPDNILTFSFGQLIVIAGFTSVLIQLGLVGMGLFSDLFDAGTGAWLGLLAAIGLLVGAVMEQEGGPTKASTATPPSPF
jgi:hypothetical protein